MDENKSRNEGKLDECLTGQLENGELHNNGSDEIQIIYNKLRNISMRNISLPEMLWDAYEYGRKNNR